MDKKPTLPRRGLMYWSWNLARIGGVAVAARKTNLFMMAVTTSANKRLQLTS